MLNRRDYSVATEKKTFVLSDIQNVKVELFTERLIWKRETEELQRKYNLGVIDEICKVELCRSYIYRSILKYLKTMNC